MRLQLTGERATDASDASGTLLLDVRARDWSDEILDALEIPRDGCRGLRGPRGDRRRCVTTWPTSSGCRAGCRWPRRRRQRGGGGRRRRRARGGGLDLDRHQRRPVRPPRRVRARPVGPRARVLPRGAGRLPPDGGGAVGRRLAQLVARALGGGADFDDARGRGGGGRAGRRGAGVPALPHGRAHAAPRPAGARRLRRPDGAPRPRAPDPRGDGGRGVLDARRPRDHARPRHAGRRRARGRRRRPLAAVAAPAGRHLRPPGPAHADRRGSGVRRRAARRGRRRRVRRRR